MIIHITISFLIFMLIKIPANIIAAPCLAVALLTKWGGKSFFFGNEKWGRATNHYLKPTKGNYWKELSWMALRNPTYNLSIRALSVKMQPSYKLTGKENIGDKTAGGFYKIKMGNYWEYYLIIPYVIFKLKKCVRLRAGWKIGGNTTNKAEWVFMFNPWKAYVA